MRLGVLPAAIAAGGMLFAIPASADAVKIGILNDQSGVYADYGGKYSLEAARMAVEDLGGNVLGNRLRRPSEQARSRHQHRTAMV
jgi:branched-chain amino acid transport system substrate-binding protein